MFHRLWCKNVALTCQACWHCMLYLSLGTKKAEWDVGWRRSVGPGPWAPQHVPAPAWWTAPPLVQQVRLTPTVLTSGEDKGHVKLLLFSYKIRKEIQRRLGEASTLTDGVKYEFSVVLTCWFFLASRPTTSHESRGELPLYTCCAFIVCPIHIYIEFIMWLINSETFT